jgi:hypothetical protein
MRSELVAKCLQLIYAQSGNANLASLAGGFLLAVLFWDIADRAILLGWGGAYLLMILYRYRLGLRFRNASPEEATRRWLNGFLVAVFLSVRGAASLAESRKSVQCGDAEDAGAGGGGETALLRGCAQLRVAISILADSIPSRTDRGLRSTTPAA